METCTQCGKKVKRLGQHLKYAHSQTAESLRTDKPKPEPETLSLPKPKPKEPFTKDELLTQTKPKPKEYVCEECNAVLKEGQGQCPGCGQKLMWGLVHGS